ncbi:H-NS histone family protein [Burkholderia cepacia]|uniref:H-NS histone family protein n=1 Tax=Burkholderia cepacia TaxID=292 RepID=UPI001589E5F5|nr:H-NS histone family protein [Burkholderia cepacia]
MMETYQHLKGQVIELTQRMEAARRIEIHHVVVEIRRLIGEYALMPKDIYGVELSMLKRHSDEVKYRNPITGQTWSGRGRPPHWLKGLDRERFRVERSADANVLDRR